MAKKPIASSNPRGSGYSGTPLAIKLGIRSGGRTLLVGAPRGFEATLEGLADGAVVTRRSGKREADLIIAFITRTADLEGTFGEHLPRLSQAGGLWIAWPKAQFREDPRLSESTIRDLGLKAGVVDVKVCAISDRWSGLKFVRRLKDRI